MNTEYLIVLTGANGHLGRTTAALLAGKFKTVRGLVLPGEDASMLEGLGVEVVRGDITDRESLLPLFAGSEGKRLLVIHTAAIIEISSGMSPAMREVNVGGTKNIAQLALEYRAERFVYVSSVHAIHERENHRRISETKAFSAELVRGGYAKTKAEAAAYVMERVAKGGLPAVVLHPVGIMGPGDSGNNYLVAVVKAYIEGRVPACIRGGYNLVDVRDVAGAVLSALENGRIGETYILSDRHCDLTEVFDDLRLIVGGNARRCPVAPVWMARMVAPIVEKRAKKKGRHPLFTKYALETLLANDNFSHEKASKELGFWPRDLYDILADTVAWLKADTPG